MAAFVEFAKKHKVTFSPITSKLLCFNASNAVTPHIKVNGQQVSVVHKDKHFGDYIFDSVQKAYT